MTLPYDSPFFARRPYMSGYPEEPMQYITRMLDSLPAPEPLPLLPIMEYPKKLVSEDLSAEAYSGEGTYDDMIRDLVKRVEAEMIRLHRLLPPAPEGYVWRWEIMSEEGFHDTIFRARWVLRPVTEWS